MYHIVNIRYAKTFFFSTLVLKNARKSIKILKYKINWTHVYEYLKSILPGGFFISSTVIRYITNYLIISSFNITHWAFIIVIYHLFYILLFIYFFTLLYSCIAFHSMVIFIVLLLSKFYFFLCFSKAKPPEEFSQKRLVFLWEIEFKKIKIKWSINL